MQQITIVTKYQFIAKNIEELLQPFLTIPVAWKKSVNELKLLDLNNEDFIIIVNDNDNLKDNSILKTITAKIVILTATKDKNSFNTLNALILTFPVFLPELLTIIQGTQNSTEKAYNTLSIPGFELILDYDKAILKSQEFKQQINITATEGKILQKLFMDYPRLVIKKDLLATNWQNNNNSSLEIHVFNIRKKLLDSKYKLEIIKDKEGYKLIIL